jgi:hypothetical protein
VPDVPAYVHVHWPNLVPADVQVKAGDMHIVQRAADQDDHGIDDADAEQGQVEQREAEGVEEGIHERLI